MHSRNDNVPVTFKSSLFGLDRAEVRAFIDNLKNDYDRAIVEAERLRRELRFEKERWFNMMATGDTAAKEMERILSAAHRVSDQIVEEARQNAETIVRTAEADARGIEDAAKTRAAELERSIEEMRTRWVALKGALASAVDHAERTLAALPDDVEEDAGVDHVART
jgi:cell division septum initiation protein DivIVA